MLYCKSLKISYTEVANKMANANNADPDQTASDQGLHCLPFHYVTKYFFFWKKKKKKKKNCIKSNI